LGIESATQSQIAAPLAGGATNVSGSTVAAATTATFSSQAAAGALWLGQETLSSTSPAGYGSSDTMQPLPRVGADAMTPLEHWTANGLSALLANEGNTHSKIETLEDSFAGRLQRHDLTDNDLDELVEFQHRELVSKLDELYAALAGD
jgi:hypothetical protein